MSIKKSHNRHILIAMSGGVDSAVACLLLAQAGHSVTGVTLGLRDADHVNETEAAVARARSVCATVGVPHEVWDLTEEFQTQVVEYFVAAYTAGITPNPCVRCNQTIKFGALMERARQRSFDMIATGHYARIRPQGAGWQLLRASDRSKDQSYFLYRIGRELLGSVLFPLGEHTKKEVRSIARVAGLAVCDTPESTDICFIRGRSYQEYLAQRVPVCAGDIVNRSGDQLGRHRGIPQYTIGQRKGLGIAASEPFYVRSIHPARNTIEVGTRKECERWGCMVDECVWYLDPADGLPAGLTVQIRSAHTPVAAHVTVQGASRMQVRFNEPQCAITPGQSAVVYEGDRLLGGGIITEAVS